MPRVVDCANPDCPLKTNPLAKFCPECGASAATKVTVTKAKCPSCGHDLEDYDRFCSECGTKVERDRVAELLANHVAPKEVTTGRGLSAEELARIEEAARAPSKVSDPVGEYTGKLEYQTNLQVPDATSKGVELAKGRTARKNQPGEHRAGGLSSDAKLPADYHEGVRLIPYKFRTPTHSSTLVEDTQGGPEGKGGRPRIVGGGGGARIAFSDDPDLDDFFRDDPEPEPPQLDVAMSKTASRGDRKPPPDPVKCHECGRFLDENGDCPYCLDEDRLANLWSTDVPDDEV